MSVAGLPPADAPHRIALAAEMPDVLAELLAEPRWLVWRWKLEAARGDKPARWTKVPFRAEHPGRNAKSNDPATWSTYAQARAAVEAGRAHGIGFALDGSQWGVFDLDACRDPDTGHIADWALALIERTGSYVEATVSGTGLRIIGRAAGIERHRKHTLSGPEGGSVETYKRCPRYIVMTGHMVEESAGELADLDAIIDAVVAELDAEAQAEATAERAERDRAKAERRSRSDFDGRDQARREIPVQLRQLIQDSVPEGERSTQFHHAVGWLKQLGWQPDEIAAELERFPDGIAEKYGKRLRAEVDRSFAKTEEPREWSTGTGSRDETAGGGTAAGGDGSPELRIFWHREVDPNAERAWLVHNTIAEVGKGLLSGQWGTYKTFLALDLSGSVMTGEPFAGRRVLRRGGVLFVAPEGAFEIPIRLRGLVEGKLRAAVNVQALDGDVTTDPADLPIAWIEECPRLVNDDAAAKLIRVAERVSDELQDRYGLPLALIVVDTVAAGAGFDDENSAAETQKVMDAMQTLSRGTGAFVLGVDHFGKSTETGTRGSSAKESAADTVLAALGSKDEAGNVTATRLALRKVRGASTGIEIPYSVEVIEIGRDRWGEPITTCVVRFDAERATVETVTRPRDRWPTSLKVFRSAILAVLADEAGGKRIRPFGVEGPEVLAATDKAVRVEFYAAYPADGETERQRSDAKRNGYNRALKAAQGKGLVLSRDVGGVDFLWLAPDAADDR